MLTSLRHLGIATVTQLRLREEELDNDSLFCYGGSSTSSMALSETLSPRNNPILAVSVDRLSQVLRERLAVLPEMNIADSTPPAEDIREFLRSRDSATLEQQQAQHQRVGLRVSARRFYRRLRRIHLNRSHPDLSFDQLDDTQRRNALSGLNTPLPTYEIEQNETRDIDANDLILEDDPNEIFDFTMGSFISNETSIQSIVRSVGNVIPIRRDSLDSFGLRISLGRSFQYIGSFLRRSRSLTTPSPSRDELNRVSALMQIDNQNPSIEQDSSDSMYNQTLSVIVIDSPTASSMVLPQGEDAELKSDEKSPLISQPELLLRSSEENTSTGLISPSINSLAYVSPISYLLDDLRITNNLDTLVSYTT